MTDKTKTEKKGEDDSPSAADGSAACIIVEPCDYHYTDSVLISFYRCKNCDAVEIQNNFEFCPTCGIKLSFNI